MLVGRIPHVSAHLTRSTPRTQAPLGPLLPFPVSLWHCRVGPFCRSPWNSPRQQPNPHNRMCMVTDDWDHLASTDFQLGSLQPNPVELPRISGPFIGQPRLPWTWPQEYISGTKASLHPSTSGHNEIWENVVVVILSRGDRGSIAASKSSILPSPRLQRRPGCFTSER
jgi:hypothetical protein